MTALAAAWQESGGTVLGLAPSAVAASVLRDHLGEATTLAKLANLTTNLAAIVVFGISGNILWGLALAIAGLPIRWLSRRYSSRARAAPAA